MAGTRPHPDPRLARRGYTVSATPPSSPSTPVNPAQHVRSQTVSDMPDLLTVTNGFDADVNPIDVPGNPSIGGGPVWYPLLSVNVRALGREVSFNSLTIEQASCDVDGGGGAGALAWGNNRGSAAALVVGVNLPIDRVNYGWSSAPCNRVGVDTTIRKAHEFNRDFAWSIGFPMGKFTDSPPFVRAFTKGFGILAARIPDGATIDVALVLRGDALPAAGAIYGYAAIQLHFAPTVNVGRFSDPE